MSAKTIARTGGGRAQAQRTTTRGAAATKTKSVKVERNSAGSAVALAPGYAVVVTAIKSKAGRAKTVNALIKALGGPLTVGRAMEIDHSSVSQWIRQGFLPSARVARLSEMFDIPVSFLKKFTSQDND